MPCLSPIDCDTTLLTPEIVLRNLIVYDSNGCPAIRVVETDDSGELITCDNNVSWKTLIMQMITTDSNGDWALRIYISDAV